MKDTSMDKYTVKFDKDTAFQSLRPNDADILNSLGVKILKINDFIRNEKRYPDVDSIFLLGQGGSYTYKNKTSDVVVQNGTLSAIDGKGFWYPSKAYYSRAFHENIYEESDFIEKFCSLDKYQKLFNLVEWDISQGGDTENIKYNEIPIYKLEIPYEPLTTSEFTIEFEIGNKSSWGTYPAGLSLVDVLGAVNTYYSEDGNEPGKTKRDNLKGRSTYFNGFSREGSWTALYHLKFK